VNVAGIQETGSSSAVNAGIEQDGSRTAAECPGPLRRTGQPMSELWHAMQLLSQVETNTEGITRVRARSSRVTVDAGQSPTSTRPSAPPPLATRTKRITSVDKTSKN